MNGNHSPKGDILMSQKVKYLDDIKQLISFFGRICVLLTSLIGFMTLIAHEPSAKYWIGIAWLCAIEGYTLLGTKSLWGWKS